ncbi:uncharacterized protein [Rutidosis leptorrhynchoides]|uniref:uncharacterized protein n=1 Tax=Rutidosis leptorrhynchoides TaxID=125765 RepID=UPI003A99F5E9
MKQQSMSSSNSSFTENLFGPKDGNTSTSSGHFGSVFGPSSTGLGNESTNRNYSGSSTMQDFGSSKHSTTESTSYLSSSIYYGGQEVYPPTTHNTYAQRTFKKGEGDEDPNASSASRGNWWQGSLYY